MSPSLESAPACLPACSPARVPLTGFSPLRRCADSPGKYLMGVHVHAIDETRRPHTKQGKLQRGRGFGLELHEAPGVRPLVEARRVPVLEVRNPGEVEEMRMYNHQALFYLS